MEIYTDDNDGAYPADVRSSAEGVSRPCGAHCRRWRNAQSSGRLSPRVLSAQHLAATATLVDIAAAPECQH